MGGCHIQLWLPLLGAPSQSHNTAASPCEISRLHDFDVECPAYSSCRGQELRWYPRAAVFVGYG